jgi:hypothetical protein
LSLVDVLQRQRVEVEEIAQPSNIVACRVDEIDPA